MEKKDLQQVDNEIVADEFAYNGTQYVVLDTSDAGDAKDMLVIMKAEMQEDETYVLTAIEEDEYVEAAKFYMELQESLDEDEE